MTTRQITAIFTEDHTSYIGRVDCAELHESYGGSAVYHLECLLDVDRHVIDECYAPRALRRGEIALCDRCGRGIKPRGLAQ